MRINRIRLEFKGLQHFMKHLRQSVLIESDWNLKTNRTIENALALIVLIESDWNLKSCYQSEHKQHNLQVLIESDWNLKPYRPFGRLCPYRY